MDTVMPSQTPFLPPPLLSIKVNPSSKTSNKHTPLPSPTPTAGAGVTGDIQCPPPISPTHLPPPTSPGHCPAPALPAQPPSRSQGGDTPCHSPGPSSPSPSRSQGRGPREAPRKNKDKATSENTLTNNRGLKQGIRTPIKKMNENGHHNTMEH